MGGSDDVTCGMSATNPWMAALVMVDGRARRPAPVCTGTECYAGGGEVRSRVGAAPRCVLMEVDVAAGLFWCAVSHVFNFAPTTRGRREL